MLPINFNISEVTVNRPLVDVKINLKDRYQHLVYTKKVLPHQVPISYIGFPPPTHKDIEINDENETSGGVLALENSFRERAERFFLGRNFVLPVRSALITDVFYQTSQGAKLPLFFKHEIEDGFEVLPEVFDANLRQVDSSKFKVVVSEGAIYIFHSLKPQINYENLRADVHYVSYTNSLGERKFKLLESTPAYKPATLEEGVNPLLRRYISRDIGTGFEYSITFNHPGPFFVRVVEGDQIKASKPLLIKTDEPWHLTISDGEVYVITEEDFAERYSLPEFHFQNFSPIEPIKFTGTRECLVLSDHLVKAPVNNISLEADEYIDILVTDENLSPQYAWSTRFDTEEFWVDRLDAFREQGVIVRFPFGDFFGEGLSIDRPSGVIYIPVSLKASSRVFIRTHYQSKELEYRTLNLNPLHNRVMQTGRAVLYVIPESLVEEDLQSLYHIILDKNEEIVSWNDHRLGEDSLNVELVGDEDETGWDKFKATFPSNLVIASVSIVRNASVDDILFVDVREKGGELTPEARKNLVELTKTYPEIQWFDFPERQMSVPLLGSLIVNVPFELLEEGGGNHSRESIEATFRKHTAIGQMPILQFATDRPVVEFLKYDDVEETLTVHWSGIDNTDQYQINLGTVIDQPFTSVEIEDPGLDGSVYTTTIEVVGDLGIADFINTGSKIFVSVSPLVSGFVWPASDIVSLDLVAPSNAGYNDIGLLVVTGPSGNNDLGMIVVEE